ncbi:5-formyltetrahydrofolate cyclo-ligase [bacterium]|nr:5-formyltetrahydrofolate cyclo-ligase [bacterium]
MNIKIDYRVKAKEIRKTLDIKKIGIDLCDKLKKLPQYSDARDIMLFYPMKYEIDVLSLMSEKNKNFYLPRIKGDILEVCPYKNGDTLEMSSFKTMEPISNAVEPSKLDIVVVPALMADKQNYRLGYGKGFYDRFLNTTFAKSIVLVAKELIVDKLPVEKHDKPVDFVITS